MRLPDIQYGATPGVSNAPTPQQAVAASAQKMNILQKAQTAADEIATDYREYNVTKADNAYADEMAQFRKETSKLSVLTPGQVAALDIDIDTEDREYVPKIEWYPKLLEKRMEEYRGKHAASIRSPIDRNRWSSEIRKNDDKILEKEIEYAAAESRKFLAVEKMNDAENAANAGMWDTARSVYADPVFSSSPEMESKRESALAAIDLAQGQETIRDEVDSLGGSPTDIREFAAYLKTDEAHEKYPLNPNQLASESDRLNSMAKVIENQAKTNETRVYNAGINEYWANYDTNPEALVANMPELHRMLPGGLKDEDRRAIYNYAEDAAENKSVRLDVGTWDMLDTMKSEEKDRFRELNLMQYRDKLSDTVYMSLKKDQTEIREQFAGKGDPPSFVTNATVMNLGLTRLDIPPTGGGTSTQAQRAEMKTIFGQALADAETESLKKNDRKINDQEKTDIINDIVMFEYTTKGKTRTVTPFEDMSSDDIVEINSTLRAANVDVNASNAAAVSKLLDKGLDASARNISIASWLVRNGQMVTEQSLAKADEALRLKGQ